jgi:hypothetical protein
MSQTATGGAGLYGAYQTGVTLSGATTLVDLTSLPPGWYDVEVYIWNTDTTGVKAVDDDNFVLQSDAVTSGTLATQALIPVNGFVIASGNGPNPVPFRTRVYAHTEIYVKSVGSGTSGAAWTAVIQAKAADPGDAAV